MEALKVHLHDLHLLLEESPDITHTLMKSDYFNDNDANILQLKGIFECMEDPKILANWFKYSKVSNTFFKLVLLQCLPGINILPKAR